VVLLKRRLGRQTSSRWRFSQKNDWIVQVIPQQAIKQGHTGALYSKNGDPAAEVGMALFTTALGIYGGVLWSGELQGFIIHETVPTRSAGALSGSNGSGCYSKTSPSSLLTKNFDRQ
jgi:hypothetical protein